MIPSDALRGSGCVICRNINTGNRTKRNHEQYLEELKLKNPDVMPVEKYINANTPILHHHKKCGHNTKMIPTSVLGGSGCVICKGLKISQTSRKTHNQFVEELFKVNQNIELLSNYNGHLQNIDCRCKICGHIWNTRTGHLLESHGCPKCASKRLGDGKRKTKEQFIEELLKINPYIEIIGEYITTNKKIDCKCKTCGYQWKASPIHLLREQGCPSCNESIGERNIRIFLDSKKIKFRRSYKFDNLTGIGGGFLSYDFYLPDFNLLIEFQGEQHERPVDYFGGDRQFKIQQEHDKRKRNYAKIHDINLLEIWYYDINNVENIIEQYLHNLKSVTVTTTGVV